MGWKIKEFGEQTVKPIAKTITAKVNSRALASLSVIGANSLVSTADAVLLGLLVMLTLIAFKLMLADLNINTIPRTQEDTCDCTKTPDDPKCKKCEKVPEPKKPFWHKPPTNGYERRVDWHHQCADNSGNSYKPEEVRIFDKSGKNISVDLFDNSTNTACEVKTSFKKEAYEPGLMSVWKRRALAQISQQKIIAERCGWRYCVVVNQQWLKDALHEEDATLDVRVYPRCRAKDFVPDPYEQPDPNL
ncbi:DUF6310 domain-containing protein [Ottowia testudinis]|uniref:DUF6310 domain-containing protein n=1 Tax=Ottowia testudinis TaxID=2816950 RepID=A0A975CC38_9BURK|nr:DUF6310 domain-containing protein [Ottowia testudinis]QTD43718.1 hypothetical protein J1M35_11145 [Ottowia testudinis]